MNTQNSQGAGSLSQSVTFGKGRGETAEVLLFHPSLDRPRVIVNAEGCFERFPGVLKGWWTQSLTERSGWEQGRVSYRTAFDRCPEGYLCLWEIQPDGRYWGDGDGFGMENTCEIILSARMDALGTFLEPFRIHKLGREIITEEFADTAWGSTLDPALLGMLIGLVRLMKDSCLTWLPARGDFDDLRLSFSLPGCDYKGLLTFKSSLHDPLKRYFTLSIVTADETPVSSLQSAAANRPVCSEMTIEELSEYFSHRQSVLDMGNALMAQWP